MNWFDLLLAVPLVWGLYSGFTNGLIMEITRIVALIAGVSVAVGFANELADLTYNNSDITNDFLPIIAFALIFIVVVVLVHFFAKAIEGLAKTVALGWANQLSGAVFGAFRMAFLASNLILLLTRFELLDRFNKGETAETSILYPWVTQVAPFLLPILDQVDRDSMIDSVDRKIDGAKETIRDIIHE